MDYIIGFPIAILSAWLFTRFLTWLAERFPIPDPAFDGRELRHKSRRTWRIG